MTALQLVILPRKSRGILLRCPNNKSFGLPTSGPVSQVHELHYLLAVVGCKT